MPYSWYKKSIAQTKSVNIEKIAAEIAQCPGVAEIFVLEQIDKSLSKQINIIASTNFNKEDLLSIIDNSTSPFMLKEAELEDNGYDKDTINFSKKIISIESVKPWCIASGKKMLYWGPVIANQEEMNELEKDAEEYAEFTSGIEKAQLKKMAKKDTDKWDVLYSHYINKNLKGLPKGWQESSYDVNEILKIVRKIK